MSKAGFLLQTTQVEEFYNSLLFSLSFYIVYICKYLSHFFNSILKICYDLQSLYNWLKLYFYLSTNVLNTFSCTNVVLSLHY